MLRPWRPIAVVPVLVCLAPSLLSACGFRIDSRGARYQPSYLRVGETTAPEVRRVDGPETLRVLVRSLSTEVETDRVCLELETVREVEVFEQERSRSENLIGQTRHSNWSRGAVVDTHRVPAPNTPVTIRGGEYLRPPRQEIATDDRGRVLVCTRVDALGADVAQVGVAQIHCEPPNGGKNATVDVELKPFTDSIYWIAAREGADLYADPSDGTTVMARIPPGSPVRADQPPSKGDSWLPVRYEVWKGYVRADALQQSK